MLRLLSLPLRVRIVSKNHTLRVTNYEDTLAFANFAAVFCHVYVGSHRDCKFYLSQI